MSDTANTTRDSCINGRATWTDETGTPIDLTGRTLSIDEAFPVALESATHTLVDALNGVSEFRIDSTIAAQLYPGRQNWLRLAISASGTCKQVTPRIWINVQ